jgi:hypothetical protein
VFRRPFGEFEPVGDAAGAHRPAPLLESVEDQGVNAVRGVRVVRPERAVVNHRLAEVVPEGDGSVQGVVEGNAVRELAPVEDELPTRLRLRLPEDIDPRSIHRQFTPGKA